MTGPAGPLPPDSTPETPPPDRTPPQAVAPAAEAHTTAASTPDLPPSGIFDFSIERRAAPALFVLGWLATLVGGAALIVGILAPPGVGGRAVFVAGAAALTIGLVSLAGSQAVEGRLVAAAGYRGPSPVLLFLAWVPASYVAWVALGLPLELLGVHLEGPPAELLYLVVQTAVAIGLVRLLIVGPGVLSWRDIGFCRSAPGAVADAAWGAVLSGPAILVTAVLATALVTIAGVAPESPLPPTGTASGLLLHLVSGAAIAPLAEEIVFRGVAISAWLPVAGRTGAIVRSSVLFAAAHVLFVGGDSFSNGLAIAAVGFLGRLPIAAFLGWAFLRRGSIWAPLGLHAAFNAVLIAAAELVVTSGQLAG